MSKPLIFVMQLVALVLLVMGGLPPIDPVKLVIAAGLIVITGKAWRDRVKMDRRP